MRNPTGGLPRALPRRARLVGHHQAALPFHDQAAWHITNPCDGRGEIFEVNAPASLAPSWRIRELAQAETSQAADALSVAARESAGTNDVARARPGSRITKSAATKPSAGSARVRADCAEDEARRAGRLCSSAAVAASSAALVPQRGTHSHVPAGAG